MHASFVDLRKKSAEIIRALKRHQRVTILYRGKPAAVMHPIDDTGDTPGNAQDHAAFGIWRDRDDASTPAEQVRELRKGRFGDL